MPEDVFRWVIAVSVILACVASVWQFVTLAALFGAGKEAGKAGKEAVQAGKEVQAKIAPLVGHLKSFITASGKVLEASSQVISTSAKILEENRSRISEITVDLAAVVKTARQQARHLSELIDEANARVKARITQVHESVGRTVAGVEQATNAIKRPVMSPIKEVNGFMAGVHAAINTYAQGGGHNSPDHATQDEELFI